MVAVRSAHINKAGEFDPEKWIASLGITSQKSCECLAETWAYCLQQTQGHPDASLLLWRGVEMVEILSTLSMDIDTLRAALLFPLADANVVSEDVLRESVGKSVVNLIHGVRDMAAIRQLKATHTDSVSSEQVDNVRRMLLAMVDDFRCVSLRRKVMSLICLRDQRRWTSLTTSTVMSDTAASGQKLAGALCRSPTSCRWATRLKLSPRNSRTPAVTG